MIRTCSKCHRVAISQVPVCWYHWAESTWGRTWADYLKANR